MTLFASISTSSASCGDLLFNYILCAYSAHVNAFRLKSSKVNFVFCKHSPQTDSIPAIQKRRACEKAFAYSHAFLSLLCDGHLPFLYFRTYFGLVSHACALCGCCSSRLFNSCKHLGIIFLMLLPTAIIWRHESIIAPAHD